MYNIIRVFMKIVRKERLDNDLMASSSPYLSLVELFGKYYVYYSIGKPTFFGLVKSVYLWGTENPVEPLCAPIIYRDLLEHLRHERKPGSDSTDFVWGLRRKS